MNVQSLGNRRVPLTAGGAASVPVIRDIVYMAKKRIPVKGVSGVFLLFRWIFLILGF